MNVFEDNVVFQSITWMCWIDQSNSLATYLVQAVPLSVEIHENNSERERKSWYSSNNKNNPIRDVTPYPSATLKSSTGSPNMPSPIFEHKLVPALGVVIGMKKADYEKETSNDDLSQKETGKDCVEKILFSTKPYK